LSWGCKNHKLELWWRSFDWVCIFTYCIICVLVHSYKDFRRKVSTYPFDKLGGDVPAHCEDDAKAGNSLIIYVCHSLTLISLLYDVLLIHKHSFVVHAKCSTKVSFVTLFPIEQFDTVNCVCERFSKKNYIWLLLEFEYLTLQFELSSLQYLAIITP
jgi:hypothetical protein